jgi:hypothetical protein
MEDLLIVIVAGVEVIFAGSEMLLTFLNDTEIFGATLYAWFLGYIVLNTIITTFIPNADPNEIIVDKKEPLDNPFFDTPMIELQDGTKISLYDFNDGLDEDER